METRVKQISLRISNCTTQFYECTTSWTHVQSNSERKTSSTSEEKRCQPAQNCNNMKNVKRSIKIGDLCAISTRQTEQTVYKHQQTQYVVTNRTHSEVTARSKGGHKTCNVSEFKRIPKPQSVEKKQMTMTKTATPSSTTNTTTETTSLAYLATLKSEVNNDANVLLK